MGAKRALIVDDSKSARVFLARILEKYEIDVDNAENAEQAIDYLASHRPDVIFMDHLMPGMDGFQAVQAIKNNPRTATIPIMMYTSQEGELYLGQARALGAVGVLPKQIRPADVSKVLYQLHLVPDRRTEEQSTFKPVNLPGDEESLEDQVTGNAAGSRALTEANLRQHFAALRRALVAGIDTQTDRITAEVRALLLEVLPSTAPPAQPGAAAVVTQPAGPTRVPVPWGWVVASVALAIALMSTALWWRDANQLNAMAGEVAELRQALAAAAAAAGSHGSSAASGAQSAGPAQSAPASPSRAGQGASVGSQASARPAAAQPVIIQVPYGADALGGPRLEAIRQLLYRLARQNVNGIVDIKTYPGRFCLVGNPTDGFSLAPDETSFAKCDLVGNPADDVLSPAQRTPLALANLIGDIRHTTRGALDVQASVGDAAATLTPYPPVSGDLTAGEWNRAGSTNNRIEIRIR
jgi:CheY-like chemotaxis protein